METWKPQDRTVGIYPTGDYQVKIRIESGTVCVYFENNLILCLNPEQAYNFEQTIHQARKEIDGQKIADTKT